jgi:hypothetical protein
VGRSLEFLDSLHHDFISLIDLLPLFDDPSCKLINFLDGFALTTPYYIVKLCNFESELIEILLGDA